MTGQEIAEVQKAMRSFMKRPCPDKADRLLALMAPHRGESTTIQRLIDQVLDYKHMVGSISKEEVASLDC